MLVSVICVSILLNFCEGRVLDSSYEYRIATNDLSGDSKYDFLMDIVLAELKFYLNTHNETVIAIPPISVGFEYDIIGIPFTGQFNASGGQFTNPASIKRQGDVSVTHSPDFNNVVVSMMVTFSEMRVSFAHYTASVIGIGESGRVNVTINNNSLFLEITVRFLPQCVVSVSRLEITEMSGVLVDMTGLGVLNPLQAEIVSWILQSYRTSFTQIIENVVQEKLQEELVKTKICKLKRQQ